MSSGHLPTGHLPAGHLPTGHLPGQAAGAEVILRGISRSLILARNQGAIDIPGQPVDLTGQTQVLILTRNQGAIAIGAVSGAGFLATPWVFEWPDNRPRFVTRRST